MKTSGKGLTRRAFVGGAAAAGALASRPAMAMQGRAATLPIIVTSWDFGPGANEAGWPLLEAGRLADAVEAAINHVELLPDEYWVGFGGVPNAVGETTLDAMFMWGPTHDVGAVGCLKRVKKAISVARAVMEKTQHTLIVGDDATRFAAAQGFAETALTNLRSQKAWEDWQASGGENSAFAPEPIAGGEAPKAHDTVGTMAIDANGQVCVGCSTNGREFKIPGRVGDSPIAGAGAYCDNDVGAAIATGNGDVMMRFLPTYHTVELMRSGMSPTDAARAAIRRITDKGYRLDGGIVALSKTGAHGAAKTGWGDTDFSYSVRDAGGATRYPVAG